MLRGERRAPEAAAHDEAVARLFPLAEALLRTPPCRAAVGGPTSQTGLDRPFSGRSRLVGL